MPPTAIDDKYRSPRDQGGSVVFEDIQHICTSGLFRNPSQSPPTSPQPQPQPPTHPQAAAPVPAVVLPDTGIASVRSMTAAGTHVSKWNPVPVPVLWHGDSMACSFSKLQGVVSAEMRKGRERPGISDRHYVQMYTLRAMGGNRVVVDAGFGIRGSGHTRCCMPGTGSSDRSRAWRGSTPRRVSHVLERELGALTCMKVWGSR